MILTLINPNIVTRRSSEDADETIADTPKFKYILYHCTVLSEAIA